MIETLRRFLGIERRDGHAARAEQLQQRSDAVLVRARRAEQRAERDRLATAVVNTVHAVRRETRHDH